MTEHLINRPAKLTKCSRCDAVTFTGITGGLTVAVDPESLTINQEIAAILAGRTTWGMHAIGHFVYLEFRGVTEIRAGRPHLVAALHRCRGARQVPVTVTTAAAQPTDTPPF